MTAQRTNHWLQSPPLLINYHGRFQNHSASGSCVHRTRLGTPLQCSSVLASGLRLGPVFLGPCGQGSGFILGICQLLSQKAMRAAPSQVLHAKAHHSLAPRSFSTSRKGRTNAKSKVPTFRRPAIRLHLKSAGGALRLRLLPSRGFPTRSRSPDIAALSGACCAT